MAGVVTRSVAFIWREKSINKKNQSFLDKNFKKFPILMENGRETNKNTIMQGIRMKECGKKSGGMMKWFVKYVKINTKKCN